MIEIKFRAWFGDKMIKPMSLQKMIHQKDNTIPLKVLEKEIIFMQYTGLKDKNGVLIFESDIVITPYRNTNGYIYYSAPSFGLKDKTGICTDFTWEDFNEFEVIGNIYEHSHLLDNNSRVSPEFKADSEIEVILKACEWSLEQNK